MMLSRFIPSVDIAKIASTLPVSLSILAMMITSPAHATISCAGYLPSSYFERIDDNKEFAGKLITLKDNTQQLQNLNGNVLIDGLTDGYVLMDKYLLAQRQGDYGRKYGVVTATGEVIVQFAYDDIQTEPDIATSFIVSVNEADGLSKQGIIDRHGYWVYPIPVKDKSPQKQQQLKKIRVDNGYGDYSPTKEVPKHLKAVDAPLNLASAAISHAHYDSDNDRDYFLIESLSEDAGKTAASKTDKVGLLDDQGSWVIPQQYDALQPLNPCTGKPLYLQASLQQQTALLEQQANIIIPFASNQNIEIFNNNNRLPLFLRSSLIEGSTATGMTEDIQDDIVSAQIIDANGKLRLSSTAPISKLLYHQLYAYQQAGQFGFIDGKGKIVLKPQFDSYRDEGDKVWVEKQGEMIRLDTLTALD